MSDDRLPVPPRAWLSRLAIPAGYRELLVHLWSYGPCWAPGDRLPDQGSVRVHRPREQIALELGRSTSTIDGRFEWLIEQRWISTDDEGGWRLAVCVPLDAESRPGHVYAIEFTNGTVKVGRSASAPERIVAHRASAAQFGIEIKQYYWAAVMDAIAAERALIIALDRVHARRAGSEWFDGGFDLALALMERPA